MGQYSFTIEHNLFELEILLNDVKKNKKALKKSLQKLSEFKVKMGYEQKEIHTDENFKKLKDCIDNYVAEQCNSDNFK